METRHECPVINQSGDTIKCALYLNDNIPEQEDKRIQAMLRRGDDEPAWVSLTPDQWRLLIWLSRNEFLWDEMEFHELAEFKEI